MSEMKRKKGMNGELFNHQELEKHLRVFIEERVEEVSLSVAGGSQIYMAFIEKINNLSSQVLSSLPEEIQSLFVEYENTVALQFAVMQEGLYRQGIIDGIRIANVFNTLHDGKPLRP